MNNKVSLLIAMFLLVACKTDRVSEPYKSDLHLPEDLSDFTSKMSERDTIKILADLTMEWWVRRDELTITKKNDEVRLQTTIREDTTFEMKYEMRINELPTVILNKPNNNFEKYFLNRLERTKDETERQYIYKVMMPNDTLILYTDVLGDKGSEVVLLVHSRKKYWSEIDSMVEREFKMGNMGKCDYGYIKWHISGRLENSFLKDNGIKFGAGPDGEVYYVETCEDKE